MANSSLTTARTWYLLATGTGAAASDESYFASFIEQDGGSLDRLGSLVDDLMLERTAAEGLLPVFREVAANGFGMTLSDQSANALIADLQSQGVSSWKDLFILCLDLSGELETTLSGRVEAIGHFNDSLQAAGKSAYFSGAVVSVALENLVQNIGASASDVAAAKIGLNDLVAALSANGIRSAVVDGYVSGATVVFDANGDGRQGAGEQAATTDSAGYFTAPQSAAGGKIIAKGGIDTLTGEAFQGQLTSMPGSTVVNPITTLVETLVSSGSSANVRDAVTSVSTALNLSPSVNPLTFDPLAVLLDGSADAASSAAALAYQSTALQVMNVITQTAATLDAAEGLSADSISDSAFAAVVGSVVAEIQSSSQASPSVRGSLNLADTAKLQSIIADSASKTGRADIAAQAESLAAVTSASNQATQSVTSVTDLAKVAKVAQGSVTASLKNAAATGGALATVATEIGDAAAVLGAAASVEVPTPPITGTPVTSPVVAPPAAGGGGGGVVTTTFTVSNDSGVVTFGGNASGDIVMTVAANVATFTRGGIEAETTVNLASGFSKITVPSGSTLTATATAVDGLTIDGAGSTEISALTAAADLSRITTNVVTASVTGNITLSGDVGEADLVVASGVTLTASYTLLDGISVSGTGNLTVTGITAASDLSTFAVSGTLGATVTENTSLAAVDLSEVDSLTVAVGKTATVTSAQKQALDYTGNVVADSTAPELSTATVTAKTKVLDLVLSEAVTGTPAERDFTVTAAGASNPVTDVSIDGQTITLTLTSTVSTGSTVSVTYAADSANPIRDAALNLLDSFSGQSVSVVSDTTPPTVDAVIGEESTANGTFGRNESLSFVLQFSERVEVTGQPTIALAVGEGNTGTATYTSGSGTNQLTFTYTVGSGHQSDDLDFVGVNSLQGTIKDLAGNFNSSTNTLDTPAAAGSLGAERAYVIDGVAPSLVSAATNAGESKITLTFDESMVIPEGFQASNFTLAGQANTTVSSATAGDSASEIVLSLSKPTLNASGQNIEVTYSPGETDAQQITDANGNPFSAGSDAISVVLTPDETAPTVVSVTTDSAAGAYGQNQTIPITVLFSEPVTYTGAAPTLQLNSNAIVTYTSGTGTNELLFNYVVGPSQSTADLNYNGVDSLSGTITDLAGFSNAATNTLPAPTDLTKSLGGNANDISIDTVAPQLSSLAANAGSKTITLTFNETMSKPTNFVATDFTIGGQTGAIVESVAVNNQVVTLTLDDYIKNSSQSSLTVDYAQSGTAANRLADAAGNAFASIADARAVTVTPKTVEATLDSVTTTTSTGTYGQGTVIPIAVNFSEPVVYRNAVPTLALNSGATVNYSSGSGTDTFVFNYTIGANQSTTDLNYNGTGSLVGDFFDLADEAVDVTLDATTATTALGHAQDIAIDTVAPTLVSATATGGLSTLSLVFSEDLDVPTGFDPGDFVVGGQSNTSVTSVSVNADTLTLQLNTPVLDASRTSLTVDYGQSATDDERLKDLAGNNFATIGDPRAVTVTQDGVEPFVASILTDKVNGLYGFGETIPIKVTFSEDVFVTGTPTLALNANVSLDYASGTGTDTLVFNYVVGNQDVDDINVTGVDALEGTIRDAAGLNVVATLTDAVVNGATTSLVGSKDIDVDGVAPTPRADASRGASDPGTENALGKTDGNYDPIIFDFSEDIQFVGSYSSGITVYTNYVGDDAIVGADPISINSGNLVIDLDETDPDINAGSTIWINIAAGVVEDLAGNDLIAITGSDIYSMTLGT